MDFLSEGLHQALLLLLALDPETFSAVKATVLSTLYAMVAATVVGLPCGLVLGYCSFPGRRFLRLISDTLLAFPTVLIGLLVYAFISRRGPLGDWGMLFTLEGMALGQTILALPIMISLTAHAVESLVVRCRQTLLTLGASPLPMVWCTECELRYALVMVAVPSFGRVVTEVGLSLNFGGKSMW